MSLLRQPNGLMLAGDWHGNLPWAFKAINHAHKEGADTILHVGDFGFWPGDKGAQFLDEVSDECAEYGIDLSFVDGNHEWHPGLDNEPDAKPVKKRERITHLPRGFRWEWWGETWMALGGAHSVDRLARTPGKDWWPEESLTDEQIEYACRPGPVDVIVAHDAPMGANIPGIGGTDRHKKWNPKMFPESEILLSEIHRRKVKKVVDDKQPEAIYHGHYHRAYQDAYRLPEGNFCRIRGLDKDGGTMGQNTLFITKGALDGYDAD